MSSPSRPPVPGPEPTRATLAPPPPGVAGSVGPPVAPGPAWSPPPADLKPAQQRRYLGYKAPQARLRRRLGALIIDGFVCAPLMIPCVIVMGGLGPGAWLVYLAACSSTSS